MPGKKARESNTRPRTMYLLNQAANGLMKSLQSTLARHKVTAKQYTVLTIVRDRQPISSAELSRRFFVTQQSMIEVVSGLEKSGFLARAEDPSNRRILEVRLTEKGQRLVQECEAVMDGFEDEAFGMLSKAQLRTLRDVLRLLLDDVRVRQSGDADSGRAARSSAG